jgi:fructan beta-fructosidase
MKKILILTAFFASIFFSGNIRAASVVFKNFDGGTYMAWQVQGTAFGSVPATGTLPNQQTVSGYLGSGYANSYHGGDNALGKLISPNFTISRPYISFLIGGGTYVGQTCINLIVNNTVVRTQTGHNPADEKLISTGWDVSDLIGQTARIEIVDSRTGGWGHINVDHIVFSDDPLTMLFEDFDGGTYAPWQVQGTAFGSVPAAGTLPNQQTVSGYLGSGYANSYHGGDNALGKLISPNFTISRPYITFLVGGGTFAGQTCINLIVNNTVVRTQTGYNPAEEKLISTGWDVSDLIGQTARIEIVDSKTGGWGHIDVDHIVFSDYPPEMGPASRTLTGTSKWLNFPVSNSATDSTVTISADGEPVRKFTIGLADGTPNWWASVDISQWQAQEIDIDVERINWSSQALNNAFQSTALPQQETFYEEARRSQFHFSAQRGWINDTNGLVYYKGKYHLFFQHNPYGLKWGNMHWGHATSTDLVHWTQHGEALFPDMQGRKPFSGSAVVDGTNSSGFGVNGNAPMVIAYTAAGSVQAQSIAYSNDGETFTTYANNPVIPGTGGSERDPKVFWHSPSGKWVMVLWKMVNSVNSMLFYNSSNLKNWTQTSTIQGDPAGSGNYLYECPDFFQLPVEGSPGQSKWILMGANASYATGTFNGLQFTSEQSRLPGLAGNFYAAQTFNNEPFGRRIQIGWLQAEAAGMPFTQLQSLPMQLRLMNTPNGLRLARTPVAELDQLRQVTHTRSNFSLGVGSANPVSGISSDLYEVRADFAPGTATQVTFTVRGVPIVYNNTNKTLRIGNYQMAAPLQGGRQRLTIYADLTAFEVLGSDGLAYLPVAITPSASNRSVSVSVTGGTASFSSLNVYELRSAWP